MVERQSEEIEPPQDNVDSYDLYCYWESIFFPTDFIDLPLDPTPRNIDMYFTCPDIFDVVISDFDIQNTPFHKCMWKWGLVFQVDHTFFEGDITPSDLLRLRSLFSELDENSFELEYMPQEFSHFFASHRSLEPEWSYQFIDAVVTDENYPRAMAMITLFRDNFPSKKWGTFALRTLEAAIQINALRISDERINMLNHAFGVIFGGHIEYHNELWGLELFFQQHRSLHIDSYMALLRSFFSPTSDHDPAQFLELLTELPACSEGDLRWKKGASLKCTEAHRLWINAHRWDEDRACPAVYWDVFESPEFAAIHF